MKTLDSGIEDYLELRRALGFRLKKDADLLSDFSLFLRERGEHRITTSRAMEFAKLSCQASTEWQARRLMAIRNFARYWQAVDSSTEIPPHGVFKRLKQRAKPHIYTDDQIAGLVSAALAVHCGQGIAELSYATIIGLLAVTGLRIGELMGLKSQDIDLTAGRLTIHSSKRCNSRIIPIHDSTIERLQAYAERRFQLFPDSKEEAFFVNKVGKQLTHPVFWRAFIRTSMECGIRSSWQGNGPRIHDFRHTFAVNTLLGWHRSGANIEQQLPVLSAYLGHSCPSHTYWYLSMIPELREIVAERLEARLGVVI